MGYQVAQFVSDDTEEPDGLSPGLPLPRSFPLFPLLVMTARAGEDVPNRQRRFLRVGGNALYPTETSTTM